MNVAESASISPPRVASASQRWFYSLASLLLLALTLIGFRLFYLEGLAYPGRPLPPPIRTLIIVHGCLMTAWMLLAVAQPLLVATKHKRLHMKLGSAGAVLAILIIVSGLYLGIESTRFSPPDLHRFGLNPTEFMAVPVLSILAFAVFVLLGVLNRYRPNVHRPMMLLASVAVMGAALARITWLNELYADTWWEVVFSALFMQVILAWTLLIAKCITFKAVDPWFASGTALLTAICVVISLGAKTAWWDWLANLLLR